MTAALKCDPSKLPKPPYPPTRSAKVPEKVDIPWEALDFRADPQKAAESRRRGGASKAKSRGYTPEQEQRIIELYKQGMTYADIGKIVGKSKSAMKQKLDKLRKEQDFRRESPLIQEYTYYTAAQDAVIREMRAQGKSYKEIGDQIGKSREAVRKRYNMIGG